MSLDKSILYLDENFAKLSNNEENQDVQRAIEGAVSALLGSAAEQDARFEGKLEPSGSFYEGTKIMFPDEFDFMVNLSRLAGSCDIVYRDKGIPHVLVRVSSSGEGEVFQSWSEFCEEISDITDPISGTGSNDGPIVCLDGSKLKQRFYSLLREAFKSVTWPENLKLVSSTGLTFDKLNLSGATQSAASEKLDFRWKDNLKVSVDLALAIECKGWPLLRGLFDRCIDEGHSAFLLKDKMQSSGFHVVPKLGVIWRISWSRAETVILKHIFTLNQQAAVSYCVAKLIKETHFVEVLDNSSASIPIGICESYSLKHFLICLWISTSSSSVFFTKTCGEILLELLKLLLDGLKTGNCLQVFANFSTVKIGPLLPCFASALEKCIKSLLDMQDMDICQVLRTCEHFFKKKIPVVLPSPPRKLSSYKITKI